MAKKSDFYLSFVNFSFWGKEIDVFANILSLLFGLAEKSRAVRMTEGLLKLKVNLPYPVWVVHNPISRTGRSWRTYMGRHQQNFPWQYPNGGIWPFAGGFWIILLSNIKRKDLAWTELLRYAEASRLNN